MSSVDLLSLDVKIVALEYSARRVLMCVEEMRTR
jgi:hypothetical protein